MNYTHINSKILFKSWILSHNTMTYLCRSFYHRYVETKWRNDRPVFIQIWALVQDIDPCDVTVSSSTEGDSLLQCVVSVSASCPVLRLASCSQIRLFILYFHFCHLQSMAGLQISQVLMVFGAIVALNCVSAMPRGKLQYLTNCVFTVCAFAFNSKTSHKFDRL